MSRYIYIVTVVVFKKKGSNVHTLKGLQEVDRRVREDRKNSPNPNTTRHSYNTRQGWEALRE